MQEERKERQKQEFQRAARRLKRRVETQKKPLKPVLAFQSDSDTVLILSSDEGTTSCAFFKFL